MPTDVVDYINRRHRARWGDEDRIVRLPRDYETDSILQTWVAAPLPRAPCQKAPGVPPTKAGQGARTGSL